MPIEEILEDVIEECKRRRLYSAEDEIFELTHRTEAGRRLYETFLEKNYLIYKENHPHK